MDRTLCRGLFLGFQPGKPHEGNPKAFWRRLYSYMLGFSIQLLLYSEP